jgi:serine/threonine-protein kinase
MPNDPDMMASIVAAKAGIYQAQGNLQEAAKSLAEINEQTPSSFAFLAKHSQMRLERNYGEAVRLLQARLAQFRYASEDNKVSDQLSLALTQRLVSDTAGAKVTAEQARSTLEALSKDHPDNHSIAEALGLANAVLGEKDAALGAAERAIMLRPSAQDRAAGPALEENLAFIQMICGENRRAISTLAELLQTPYSAGFGRIRTPITPALLRLDPIWDLLRSDPAFQKLCEEKQK